MNSPAGVRHRHPEDFLFEIAGGLPPSFLAAGNVVGRRAYIRLGEVRRTLALLSVGCDLSAGMIKQIAATTRTARSGAERRRSMIDGKRYLQNIDTAGTGSRKSKPRRFDLPPRQSWFGSRADTDGVPQTASVIGIEKRGDFVLIEVKPLLGRQRPDRTPFFRLIHGETNFIADIDDSGSDAPSGRFKEVASVGGISFIDEGEHAPLLTDYLRQLAAHILGKRQFYCA